MDELCARVMVLPSENWDAVLAECHDPAVANEARELLDRLRPKSEQHTVSIGSKRAPSKLSSIDPEQPVTIGRYRILAPLGEGGFGIVYEAEQSEPVRRRVALKVIKPGMDSRSVVARFEAERQALALMDHSGVAKVFDGGVTEAGLPYFVMELVRGEPITAHCDHHTLSINERLELFVRVCRAVQHAHSKGIIHRDLKPSNILVVHQDGVSTPKVIDFGIAKALNQRLAENTIFTEHGQMIGTPEYMSPEQADRMGEDIDTRSDVYSLGVVLYEMLVGAPPFDPRALRRAGYAEIQRILREVEPPKPSTRLRTLLETPENPAMAEHLVRVRRVDAASLSRVLKRDLDWVLVKCLEKDRERRYTTPTALADDLERFLTSRPVIAGPPSARYVFARFVRRNRGPVIAGTALVLTLIAGVVGTTTGLIWALDESERANRRAEQVQRMAVFQQDQLEGLDPSVMGLRWIGAVEAMHREALTARGLEPAQIEARIQALRAEMGVVSGTEAALTVLDESLIVRSRRAIDERFTGDPELHAALLQSLATTARRLGLLDRAHELQARVLEIRTEHLGELHPDTVESISEAGLLAQQRGELNRAATLLQDAYLARDRMFGPDHQLTLQSLMHRGVLRIEQGQLDAAWDDLNTAFVALRDTVGADHPETRWAKGQLAVSSKFRDDSIEAERDFRSLFDLRGDGTIEDDLAATTAGNNLAMMLNEQARFDEAEPIARRVAELRQSRFGASHPLTSIAKTNHALTLIELERYEHAEPLLLELLARYRRSLGPDHKDTLMVQRLAARVLERQGKTDLAGPLHRASVESARRTLGPTHPETLQGINDLGMWHLKIDEPDKAVPWLRESYEGSLLILGKGNLETIKTIGNLAWAMGLAGDPERAEPFGREAVRLSRAHLPPGHGLLGANLHKYAISLIALKRFELAEDAVDESYTILRLSLGANNFRTQRTVRAALDLYTEWHEADPSAGHDEALATWTERLIDP